MSVKTAKAKKKKKKSLVSGNQTDPHVLPLFIKSQNDESPTVYLHNFTPRSNLHLFVKKRGLSDLGVGGYVEISEHTKTPEHTGIYWNTL